MILMKMFSSIKLRLLKIIQENICEVLEMASQFGLMLYKAKK